MRPIKARKVKTGPLSFFMIASIFLILTVSAVANDKLPTSAESAAVTETTPAIQEQPVRAAPAPTTSIRHLPDSTASATPINPSANLASLVAGLLFILAVIFALAWLVRRMGQGGFMNNPHIRLVAAMPLGTRERLAVVDVGGQQLLLGITATQINTLHVFAEPVVPASDTGNSSDFGKKFLAVLQQKSRVQGSAPSMNQESPQ